MDDFGHAKISGMTLVGNRVDAVTGGASHGIHCPGTAYTATTQYHASLFCFDLEVVNFTGSGIVTGDNRNLLWLNHVITRYCNANGLVIGGVDNKISNCEFGATTDAAVKLNSGGTTSWSNSYFYFCDGPCLYAANTAVGPNWFVNCVFDSPKVDCVNINGPTDASPYSFVNCRFSVPGRTKNPNGFSHIRANNLKAINIHNCYFAPRGAEEKSEYLLRLTNVGHVSWIGNHWDLADPPYKTDTISGTYTSITRSDTAGGLAINALHAENGANLAVGGNLSLQSASNADVRYVQRGTSASVNPLVRLGMAGVGVNKLQGRFGIELKKTDIAGGGLNEIFAVTPTGNILIGNPTEANATNGIQIKEGGTIFGNPVNSGFLYVEAGALKYKGSAGTVTTIAPA
jgi:hypothetical protein